MTRILFFGMFGILSRLPFERLLTAGVDVCAVVIPATGFDGPPLPRRVEPRLPALYDLPLHTRFVNKTILHCAWEAGIPVWEVDNLGGQKTLSVLASFQPNLICVACFPHIFPAASLKLPAYGCLNLHPSLLPAYRGPTPLFWMMRQGEAKLGVTLHFLDEGIDSGDIVSQAMFDAPDGITEAKLTHCCGEMGAQLLVSAVKQLERGSLPRRAQPYAGAAYFASPGEEDFHIPRSWSARRAFNFLRGAGSWPLTIEVESRKVPVRRALTYEANQTLDATQINEGNVWQIQFNPGTLWAVI